MHETNDPHRFLVAAAIKDEGAFLVEWICWYRMIGFDHILICSNDCTDHSPQMLDAFEQAGWITHAPHQPKAGKPPKRSAHRTIRNHPLTAQTEWLFLCDVDEFLVLHTDTGTINDFIGPDTPDFLGMGLHWKCFGTSGHTHWQDGLTHRMFTNASPQKHQANTSFKSLFRNPVRFAAYGAHSPRKYDEDFGERPNVWVDCKRERLWRFDANNRPQRATAPSRVRHRYAQLNHYVIRSEESFAMKRGIPSASANVDRYTDAFYDCYNRNEEPDLSALRFAEKFDDVHAEAMALPGIRRLHHLSCADYVARLARSQGKEPQDDARFGHHLSEADS